MADTLEEAKAALAKRHDEVKKNNKPRPSVIASESRASQSRDAAIARAAMITRRSRLVELTDMASLQTLAHYQPRNLTPIPMPVKSIGSS